MTNTQTQANHFVPAQAAMSSKSVWYMGNLMKFHLTGEDTGGKIALIEAYGGPGGEPPLHVHEREDELFYILEGELLITRGGQQHRVGPGNSIFLPRLVPHTFQVLTPRARALVTITPAGFENYFRELGVAVEDPAHPPVLGKPDFERIAQTAVKYGTTMLGAPVGAEVKQ